MAAVDDYSQALDYLRLLARQDFADWWARRGELTDAELKAVFVELAANYGDEAASAAVDYLVMSRSLDDELAGLPFPERADPVAYEQAAASYQWAVNTSTVEGKFLSAVAAAKLAGVLDRLVCLPAHQTVVNTVLRDGTAFARVPEPGACGFCLMLASRGAVYSAETVGRVNKFHDHCRCLGIECKRDGSDLPRINRDLEQAWVELSGGLGRVPNMVDWDHYLAALREQSQGKDWPKLRFVRAPRYSRRDAMSPVFPGEKLPPLDKMPGHVLHGWRDDDKGRPHNEQLNLGHRWDSQRSGASKFPKEWTDQQIVDAVRDTIEFPEWTRSTTSAREVWRKIEDELVYGKYLTVEGREMLIMAYPVDSGKIPPRAKKVSE